MLLRLLVATVHIPHLKDSTRLRVFCYLNVVNETAYICHRSVTQIELQARILTVHLRS
jgi:hypothetical protein